MTPEERETVDAIIADNRALAERAEALHKALRSRVLMVGVKKWRGCDECKGAWNDGEPERHAANCLAAPSAPKEQQQTTGD